MKKTQPHTPKYWVLHDPDTDDVLIETAAKCRTACETKGQDAMYKNENLVPILVEIKMVEM